MTREELHELVDIVMDARENTNRDLEIQIGQNVTIINWNFFRPHHLYSESYCELSDFTQAVKDYIKSLG